jgi:hypothetical protein
VRVSSRYIIINNLYRHPRLVRHVLYCVCGCFVSRVVETCEIALKREDKNKHGVPADTNGNLSDIPEADFLAHSHRVVYSELLREKNGGVFEGRPKKEMESARKRHGDERVFRPEGGESWNDVMGRVQQFVVHVQQQHPFNPTKDKGEQSSKGIWCPAFPIGGSSGVAASQVATVQVKKILVFTSGGVIKEFINAFVYRANTPEAAASSYTNYYPNNASNCSMFMFRCSADFSDVKMVLENLKPDTGPSSWDSFLVKEEEERRSRKK